VTHECDPECARLDRLERRASVVFYGCLAVIAAAPILLMVVMYA
jgi:hypothetical protein